MLSPYERLLLAYFGKQPDQIPVAITPFPVLGVPELEQSAGRANPEYPKWDRVTRIQKAIEFHVNFAKQFPAVCTCGGVGSGGHGDKAVHLAQILGSQLGEDVVLKESSKGGYVYSKPLIEDLATFDTDTLYVPDLRKETAMNQALNNLELRLELEREAFQGLEDHAAIGLNGWASTRCVEDVVDQGLIPYRQFLIGMRLWPDKVHKLCAITAEYVIDQLQLIEKVMGKITKLTIADHCTTFMSLRQATEFWVPYVKQVNRAFSGALRVYHNEGHIIHLVKLIVEAGFDAYQVGPETDLTEVRTITDDKLALYGNIDPVYTFPSGSPNAVEAACRQAIIKGGQKGGFILSTGGGPPRSGAPVQNLNAMITAARTHGRYPISLE